MRIPSAAAWVAFALLAPGCFGSPAHEQVVTTFYPLEYLTKRIAEPQLSVGVLIPSGAEPHEYELKPSDLARVQRARLVVYQGVGLEAFEQRLVSEAAAHGVKAQKATQGLAVAQRDEGGTVGPDPHLWLDPVLAMDEARNIERAVEAVDPGNASAYRQHLDAVLSDLAMLDSDYSLHLAHCANPKIITTHAAFGYLAARYHFTMLAISGFSPDAEPSAQKIKEMADLAKREKISVIFFETLVSPRVAQVIASEIHGRTEVLDPIEGIAPQDAAKGATYLTVMRDNLANLRDAMGCTG
jgi:zinc transport system substrate-binding protein